MGSYNIPLRRNAQIKDNRCFLVAKSGITTVEFAISFGAFITMLLFLFEVCRFIALASTLDLSLSEAARLASRNNLTSSTYLDIFNKNLRDENRTFTWFFFKEASMDELELDIKYCSKISDVINDSCNNDTDKRIAVYNIAYRYSPLFLPLPVKYFNGMKLDNYIVYVQEHAKG